MTRYKTHTETQLAKINATLTKLLAAQLETNRLLAAYFAPVAHDPAPGRAVLMRKIYDGWPYGPKTHQTGQDGADSEKAAHRAQNGAGPQADATGPAGGPDNAGGFTQITIDDLLGPADEPAPDDVWADLGYVRGTN